MSFKIIDSYGKTVFTNIKTRSEVIKKLQVLAERRKAMLNSMIDIGKNIDFQNFQDYQFIMAINERNMKTYIVIQE